MSGGYIRSKLIKAGDLNTPDYRTIQESLVNGAPAGPFTPKSLPGLQIWLDASDASTLNLTGSTVNSWTDKSTNGYVYSSINGGNPVMQSDGTKTGVYFSNATNQILGCGTQTIQNVTTNGYFCAIVMNVTSVTLPLMFAVNKNNSSQVLGLGVAANAGVYNDILMSSMASSSEISFRAQTTNGFATDISGKRVQVGYSYDGSGYTQSNTAGFGIYFGGNPLSILTASAVGSIVGQNTVGGWANNGNRVTGYHFEVVYYNQAQSVGAMNQLFAYYSAKWGV